MVERMWGKICFERVDSKIYVRFWVIKCFEILGRN